MNNNRTGLSKKNTSSVMNNLMSLVEPSFDEAIFFDNDQLHVDNVAGCGPRITSVKVPGSDGKPSVLIRFTKEERATHPYAQHVDGLSKKAKESAMAITRIILSNGMDKNGKDNYSKQVENLDVGSGINAETIAYLQDWVRARKGKKLAVLFDYDRTLTVIEGGFFLKSSFAELKSFLKGIVYPFPYDFHNYADLITPEGFIEYYVGGFKRLEMLQKMFDFLYENNVAVFLLTNNTACQKNKGMFEEILAVLTRNRPVQILCGSEFQFDKKATLQRQLNLTPGAPLKALCTKQAGGRKKTRSLRKKRRATRRC